MSRVRRAPRAASLLRFVSALVLALALAMIPGTAFAEKTIGLSSGTFAFEVEPGDTGEGEVVVSNDGDEPLKALVYVTDVKIDGAGEQDFVEPQREGASILTTPASWFRIFMPADSKSVGNTPYIELDPGERLPIRFEFSPPPGTPSGDHNVVIFFEMFELAEGSDGAAAQVSGRLGARVALRVTGPVIENLTIRPFDVPSFRIGNAVPFTFTVNNAGNTNKRVQATAELLDRSERTVVASVVASDTAVYADSRYRFEGALSTGGGRLGPHTFEVKLRYFLEDASTPTELIEQRTVWLVPMWLVLVLFFIVFDILVYGAYRAWRGRERKPSKAAAEVQPSDEGARRASVVVMPTADYDAPSSTRRTDRRMSRKERELEAEERRQRREQRAAEAAGRGTQMPPREPSG